MGNQGYGCDEDTWRMRSNALTSAFYLWEAARDERTAASMAELEMRESSDFSCLEEDEDVNTLFLAAWRGQLSCILSLPDRL